MFTSVFFHPGHQLLLSTCVEKAKWKVGGLILELNDGFLIRLMHHFLLRLAERLQNVQELGRYDLVEKYLN